MIYCQQCIRSFSWNFKFLLAFIDEIYKEMDVEEEDNKGIEETEGGHQLLFGIFSFASHQYKIIVFNT